VSERTARTDGVKIGQVFAKRKATRKEDYLYFGAGSRLLFLSHFIPLVSSRRTVHTPLVSSPDSDVCTKYQEAAKIVNLALTGIVSQCIAGAKILDVCEFGHTVITAGCAKLYTKKVNGVAVDRGVAFPVCVSVNDTVCNHSPLPTEERVRLFESIYFVIVLPCLGQPKCATIACRCPVFFSECLHSSFLGKRRAVTGLQTYYNR
jgi:hypothetical protein